MGSEGPVLIEKNKEKKQNNKHTRDDKTAQEDNFPDLQKKQKQTQSNKNYI